MATVLFRNAFFWVNGVDLSSFVRQIAMNRSSEVLDETAMGDDTRKRKGGLFVWEIDGTFKQDFGAAGPWKTLYSLVGTTACFELRPSNSCSTATNPSFSGIVIVETNPIMQGAVGTLLEVPFRLVSAGSLTQASSS